MVMIGALGIQRETSEAHGLGIGTFIAGDAPIGADDSDDEDAINCVYGNGNLDPAVVGCPKPAAPDSHQSRDTPTGSCEGRRDASQCVAFVAAVE